MKRYVVISFSFIFVLALCSAWRYASAQPVGFMSPQVVKQTQPQCLFSPKGRFVFGQISDSSKDQFMLDTWTGRLWRISESGAVGKFLIPVPYKLKSGKYSPVPEKLTGLDNRDKKKK